MANPRSAVPRLPSLSAFIPSITPRPNGFLETASGAISAAQSVIKAHAVGIKVRQFRAQQWREFQRRVPGRGT